MLFNTMLTGKKTLIFFSLTLSHKMKVIIYSKCRFHVKTGSQQYSLHHTRFRTMSVLFDIYHLFIQKNKTRRLVPFLKKTKDYITPHIL